MEGFLYTIGLTGPVAEYVKLLAKQDFYSPEDLIIREPTVADLVDFGITNPRDANLIFNHICPQGNDDPNDIDFGIDVNATPDFDVDPNEDPGEMDEDDYERMKREYEMLMGGGISLEADPVPTEPEDDDYEKMKASFNQMMSQGGRPYVKEEISLPDDFEIDFNMDDTPTEPDEDDYEQMKAKYESLMQQSNLTNFEVEPIYENPVPEPEPEPEPIVAPIPRSNTPQRVMITPKVQQPRPFSQPKTPSHTPQPVPVAEPSPVLSLEPDPDDAYERAKAEYEKMLLLESEPNLPKDTETNRPSRRPALAAGSRPPGSLPANKPTVTVTPKLGRPGASLPALKLPGADAEPVVPEALQTMKAVPIQGAGITGVKLMKDPAAQAQLEALKALAASGSVSFGNELSIEVLEPANFNGELFYSVRLTTNMRQFSHLTFHRLDTQRRHQDFEDLHKKLVVIEDYASTIPKFPKKKEKANFMIFNQMMTIIARDPGLNQLSCVVDFFDNTKYGATAKLKDSSTPRGKDSSTPRGSTPRGSFFKKKETK